MLTDVQKAVVDEIARETLMVINQVHEHEETDARVDRLEAVSRYAWALYMDLTTTGHAIVFSPALLTNRKVLPTDPEFFQDTSSLKELVERINVLVYGSGASEEE